MGKTEVIVDTCFLQKLSSEGGETDNIKKVLNELEYIPVVHPYIYEHELSLHSYFVHLVDEGYIRVIQYNEFQKDASDKQSYEAYYNVLYEDMRLALEAIGGLKQIEKLCLHKGQTIYNTHKQGSSMGDVHMILMASYLQMPILLTEDSDIDMLRDIAKRRMRLGQYSLQIFNGIQLIEEIAKKEDSSLTIKEIEAILKAMGKRSVVSDIKAVWRQNHIV
ncbi:MAG: hypothetical protein HDQ98_09490 [Lachnospiraceae bacterium]|nr:hypothetical protein [Lachnospiraceae bacterium]